MTGMVWQSWQVSLRWLVRALVKGDWLWLWLAIVMASFSVTFVALLSDSVSQSMVRQASVSLGADAVLRSTRPIALDVVASAQKRGLHTSQSVSFMTMMQTQQAQFQLVQLKAVDDAYPLRGEALVWPEAVAVPSVRVQQSIYSGAYSNVVLGKQTFGVFEAYQPNALEGMNALAPEVMIRLTDLAGTSLLGAGSRAVYSVSVRAETAQQGALSEWITELEKREEPAWKIVSASAPTQDMSQALSTANLFLQLSALSAVLVAGLAVLIASQFYFGAWQEQIGLLRAMGASQAQVSSVFSGQITFLGIGFGLLGAALAVLVFGFLSPWVEGFFPQWVRVSYLPKLGYGVLLGVAVLWLFAWPAYREVVGLAPIKILRGVSSRLRVRDAVFALAGLAFIVFLLVGWQQFLWVLLGLIVVGGCFYFAAVLMLCGVAAMQLRVSGWLRVSLSMLTREAGLFKLQVMAFGLVLFVLMVLTLIRQDLFLQWQAGLSADAPNAFIMNVQPDQKAQTLSILKDAEIAPGLVPMARGRLVALNGKVLKAADQKAGRARSLLEREANIALLSKVPIHNEVVEATESDKVINGVSIEQGIAELYGIALGDKLTFDFLGEQVTEPVVSIRKVVWQSLELNFFFILPDSYLERLPYSFIGSFYLAPKVKSLHQQLNEQVPGVFLIELNHLLKQIQDIMQQASWAVTGLYGFTIVSSFLVLLSAIFAGQQARIQSWMLLRTMGVTGRDVIKMGLMEFLLLGAISGLVAATMAQLASGLLSVYVFNLDWRWQPLMWLWSVWLGVVTLLAMSWMTQRRYLGWSAMQLKRHLSRLN